MFFRILPPVLSTKYRTYLPSYNKLSRDTHLFVLHYTDLKILLSELE